MSELTRDLASVVVTTSHSSTLPGGKRVRDETGGTSVVRYQVPRNFCRLPILNIKDGANRVSVETEVYLSGLGFTTGSGGVSPLRITRCRSRGKRPLL